MVPLQLSYRLQLDQGMPIGYQLQSPLVGEIFLFKFGNATRTLFFSRLYRILLLYVFDVQVYVC